MAAPTSDDGVMRDEKSKARAKQSTKKMAPKVARQLRTGMPAADSVREVRTFVSPQGVRYTILKTSERDAYDKPHPLPKSRKGRGRGD